MLKEHGNHGCNYSAQMEAIDNFFKAIEVIDPFNLLAKMGISENDIPKSKREQLEVGRDFRCLKKEDVIFIINSSEIAAENRLKSCIAAAL